MFSNWFKQFCCLSNNKSRQFYCAHAVFERCRVREWYNPSGTSSNGRGDSLEQSFHGVDNSKSRRTLRQQFTIIYWNWQQHPTRHQLYGHLPPITKTIQVRRTRHAGLCWRSKDELISDVFQWTFAYGQAKAGRPHKHTYCSYVRIRNVALKTCQRRWMIGRSGERGSGISVLAIRHDDDDDDDDDDDWCKSNESNIFLENCRFIIQIYCSMFRLHTILFTQPLR